ncbi:hypothetical protein [Chromobacterium subtsugae]|uniref:hypothetical protein n=1 Tax=Chromobacterium subtsugae TaxID=251747 RepID=UPI00128DEFA8|nr:hypothetical protein [Chromobacterium subtsugae]
MMEPSRMLQKLLADHDDDLPAAAEGLHLLADAEPLSDEELSSLSWLINHVVGESQGGWQAAWSLQQKLLSRAAAPRLLRSAAVAAGLGGQEADARQLEARLAEACGVSGELAGRVVRFASLQHLAAGQPPRQTAQALAPLLAESLPPASGQDAALAAALNNIVSALLDHPQLDEADEAVAQAMRQGADRAHDLWLRAGTWLNRERARYLQALVENRLGDAEAALRAADAGLALIAANGPEDVDQAFLLLERARACRRLDRRGEAEAAWEQARRLAEAFDPALREWFDRRAQALAAAPA